jgi:hypothetical protein
MNLLQAEEEAMLLGQPYAAIQCYGNNQQGDTIAFTVSYAGAPYPVSYLVQPSDVSNPFPTNSIAIGIANAVNQANIPNVKAATGVYTASDGFSIGLPPTFGQVTIYSTAQTFQVAMTSSPGVALTADGSVYPNPAFTLDDSDPTAPVIIYGILPICNALESALVNSSQNLSFNMVGSNVTGQAVFRKDELAVRQSLYKAYVYQLGVSLSYYPPPYSGSGIGSFGIRI